MVQDGEHLRPTAHTEGSPLGVLEILGIDPATVPLSERFGRR